NSAELGVQGGDLEATTLEEIFMKFQDEGEDEAASLEHVSNERSFEDIDSESELLLGDATSRTVIHKGNSLKMQTQTLLSTRFCLYCFSVDGLTVSLRTAFQNGVPERRNSSNISVFRCFYSINSGPNLEAFNIKGRELFTLWFTIGSICAPTKALDGIHSIFKMSSDSDYQAEYEVEMGVQGEGIQSQTPNTATSSQGSVDKFSCPSEMLKKYARGPFDKKKPLKQFGQIMQGPRSNISGGTKTWKCNICSLSWSGASYEVSELDAFGSSRGKRKVVASNPLVDMYDTKAREEADDAIGKFFFATGIPFHVARSPYFKEAVAKIAKAGVSYVPPGDTKLRTTILDKNYSKLIVWKKKDAEFQFTILRDAIEEVGPANVVQMKAVVRARDPTLEFYHQHIGALSLSGAMGELNTPLHMVSYALNPKWYVERPGRVLPVDDEEVDEDQEQARIGRYLLCRSSDDIDTDTPSEEERLQQFLRRALIVIFELYLSARVQ
ncbi:hypothetical protein KI387_005184, partial [Taxus chinensis]